MRTEIICGRKVWVERDGWFAGGMPQIWIYFNPHKKADIYLKGSSLREGTDAQDAEYLESLVKERFDGQKPISEKMEYLWNSMQDRR